jgi:hypothetical protein
MVNFTTLLEVIVSKTKMFRNSVKLVRCEFESGSSIVIQIGRWRIGEPKSKFMVSLNSSEMDFVIESIPKVLETSPRTLEYTTGYRNIYLVNDGSKTSIKQETEHGWREVFFFNRDIQNILSVLQCVRFFQAPGEQTPEWIDSVLRNVFLQLVEKEMKDKWLDYQEALQTFNDNKKSEFVEQVAKVMRLFNFPEPDSFFLDKQWELLYKQAILQQDVHYDKERYQAVYQPIDFLFDTDLELFFNTF